MTDTKVTKKFPQILLGIFACFVWNFIYNNFIFSNPSIFTNHSSYILITYFLLTIVFTFLTIKYTNYKVFALTFLIASILPSILAFSFAIIIKSIYG